MPTQTPSTIKNTNDTAFSGGVQANVAADNREVSATTTGAATAGKEKELSTPVPTSTSASAGAPSSDSHLASHEGNGPATPAGEGGQKKKTFATLIAHGVHAKLSRSEAIARASAQKRVIGDRADRHWAFLLILFFVVNIAFALWHVMVFRGIAAGDLFVASSEATNNGQVKESTKTEIDVPAEVRARLETFSKRNDKVIKVVDPSL